MIAILFLVVLLAALWTAVIVIPQLQLIIAIVPTLVFALAGAAIFVYRRLQARKAAQEIERSLKAQSDEYAKQVPPDQQPEIQAMQAEFSKAVSSLKSSKLARGGQDALSILPWYLIIGPPGVGKTTALRNSSLQFPYLSAKGGGVRGVGGTRNCEWWLTNEAVILDTAGRYTTEDDDRDEWFSFLDMLVKTRPRKPINGILVAVSIGDFIGLDEEGAAALGQTLRERVDEAMERLKIIVPVYAMFTKCDLLAGFVEIFGDLPKAERGQIWGATEPVSAKLASISDTFLAQFDELTTIVEQRALAKLSEARRLEDRERIFQFPTQVTGLRANLNEFIQTLFAENVYRDTPLLRGFYLSSATQVGNPIDRMMKSMASAFGIRGALPAASQTPPETKSYFLQDVFTKVIFKDQDIAVRSTKERKRQGLLQRAYAGGGLGIALIIALLPLIPFCGNYRSVQSTRQLVSSATKLTSNGKAALQQLNPLRAHIEELLADRDSLHMAFGMYQGDELLPLAARPYGDQVRRVLVGPVFDQDRQKLDNFVHDPLKDHAQLSPSDLVRHFNRLKLYLLLSDPAGEREPKLGKVEQEWVVQQLVTDWTARSGGTTGAAAVAQPHAALFVNLLSQKYVRRFQRDEQLVAGARKLIRQYLPVTQRVLQTLIDSVSGGDSDITVANILDPPLPELNGKGSIRGAFTKKKYRESICPKFEAANQNADAWVDASEQTVDDPDFRMQQLHEQYFKEYIGEWRTFIKWLSLQPAGDKTKSAVLVETLTTGEPPPFKQLFQTIANNVRLIEPVKADETKASGSILTDAKKYLPKELVGANGIGSCQDEVWEKKVGDAFDRLVRFGVPDPSAPKKQTRLDQYQAQLDALKKAQGAPAAVKQAKEAVDRLIKDEEEWHSTLEALLLPPFKTVVIVVNKEVAEKINQDWCTKVYDPFKKNLLNRYPFKLDGADALLGDLTEFFRPKGGILSSFYEQELQQHIKQSGDKFYWAHDEGIQPASIYNPQLLVFLSKAHTVTSALFSLGSPDAPQFNFAVRGNETPLREVRLTVDGEKFAYFNQSKEWQSMKWPGTKEHGASLWAEPRGGAAVQIAQQPGDWGFFKLLEQGTVRNVGPDFFTIAWKLPNSQTEVQLDIKPQRSETPWTGQLRKDEQLQLSVFRNSGVKPPTVAGRNTAGCN
jgi:type VI secretion system protein ImpL